MGETADKTEVYFEHPGWLFVIIPVQRGYEHKPSALATKVPPTEPLYAAYCKRCGTYVTQVLEYNDAHTYDHHKNPPKEGKIDLPKYGCVGPEETMDRLNAK